MLIPILNNTVIVHVAILVMERAMGPAVERLHKNLKLYLTFIFQLAMTSPL